MDLSGRKTMGCFHVDTGTSNFCVGRFGIFWPQFLKYSQFYSRLLLSTYCYFAAGREYIGGH